MTGERRVVAYLDTADWSYLEDGRAPDAELRLRELGRRGVMFMLSFEHLLEIAGLTSGRAKRLAFLREFPGTVVIERSGVQMLNISTINFVRACLGVAGITTDHQGLHASGRTISEWMEIVDRFVVLRAMQGWSARLSVKSPRDVGNRKQRDIRAKMMRLARDGDVGALVDHLKGKAPGVNPLVRRILAYALVRLHSWAQSRGWRIPRDRREEAFEKLVTGCLPSAIRMDVAAMTVLREKWADRALVADISPGLACVANLFCHQQFGSDADKLRSDENDRGHAAFAPMVDVFTCDKRNYAAIHQTLAAVRPRVNVLRTRRLLEAAEILEARLNEM